MAWQDRAIWIADAKYKSVPARRPPDRGDQYQMFAYTHLLDDADRTVERALLTYPGSGAIRSWRRGRDRAQTPVQLATVRIPFPQRTDARTASTWDAYLEDTAERFREAVKPLQLTP